MGVRLGLLLIVALVITALAVLNWGTLGTSTSVSIGLMQATAPLGLIMLGLTALMGLLFMSYLVHLQGTSLLETRRHAKEIRIQRELADRAEGSRFSELRSLLETQERSQMVRLDEQCALLQTLVQRLDHANRQPAA